MKRRGILESSPWWLGCEEMVDDNGCEPNASLKSHRRTCVMIMMIREGMAKDVQGAGV